MLQMIDMTRVIRVSDEVYEALVDHVKKLHGHVYGHIRNEVDLLLAQALFQPSAHTKNSVAGQATLNPGLVIPKLAGVDKRRAAKLIKVIEDLTADGKYPNPQFSRDALKCVVEKHVANYHSAKLLKDFIELELCEEQGGLLTLKIGVSEQIRRAFNRR